MLFDTYHRLENPPLALRARIAHQARSWLPLAALLLAIMGFGLITLMRTPPPFLDEVWFTNRAWALVQTGLAFGTLDSGVFDRFEGYWTYFPWLGTWFQSLAMRAFGLSLFAVRLTSLVFGIGLLLAVYGITSRLGGRRLGLLAVLMVGLSRAFLYSSHLGRPEIIVAAFGFGALALYCLDSGSSWSIKSVLAGLAVGLAFETHPFGYIYGPVIGMLFVFDYRWAVFGTKRFWSFVLGGLLGLAFYASLHILPYPQTYFAINALVAGASGAVRTPPLLVPDPAVWLQSAVDMLTQFWSLWNIRIPLIIAAAFLLAKSQSDGDKRLLRLSGLLLLAYLLLIRNKNPWYAILVAPAGDLLVAVALERLLRMRNEAWAQAAWLAPVRRWLGLAPAGQTPARGLALRASLLVGLAMLTIAPTIARTLNDPMDDYQATLATVAQSVPSGSVVMGPATYWLALTNEHYISWEQLIYYRRYAPGSSVEEAIHAFGADYFITDRYIEQFFRDTPRVSVNAQQLLLPQAELEGFLARRTRLAATIQTETYGDVRIYKIDWDS